ncbi:MAG TPA: DEAD/DEAH box helicase [Thermoanaerobaculia bacterium]|nr:DEAD/DEAH box helicase [Thermoanaerobaculia bacterium]
MPADTTLRRFVAPRTLTRGDAYYAQGRVRRLEKLGSEIHAEVQGSLLYSVQLLLEGDRLTTDCTCPWFQENFEECKHIWAVIRAASARRMLPERALIFAGDMDEDDYARYDDFDENIPEDYDPPVRTFPRGISPRPQRPPWQRFLDALGPVPPPANQSTRSIPEEIAYVIESLALTHRLNLEILGRAHKKNGEWGKWKPLSLRLDELHLLPSPDREMVALLNQNSWARTVERIATIPPSTTAWWIEKIARAGKLRVFDREDNQQPIAWDDGPAWTLRVAIVNDAEASTYRIAATIERDGETLPVEAVEATFPGVLISGERASRFDDGGRAAWLDALRASGSVEIPHADADSFRKALLRAPIANIALPEELGWSLIDIGPRPILTLQDQSWTSELSGELFFEYDEWRVSSRSEEMQSTIGRKLIRRNGSFEEGFRGRLASLGVISTWDGYRLRLAQLDEVVRALSAEGWTIELGTGKVRVADDFDVEISSGIDWFDLSVSATFDDVRIALPELLAATGLHRSLLRLPDGSFGVIPSSWSASLAPVLELGKREGDSVRYRSSQALLIDALLRTKTQTVDDAFSALRQRISEATPEPRQEPPTFTAELRPYQRAGLGWMEFLRTTGLGGCLADDMGLGKTVQALALLEGLRVNGNAGPSLVVAPRSLLFNWAAEARRFAPQLRVIEHHGSEREKNDFTGFDLVLTTYATMRLDIGRLAETEFEYVILDESQAIKNASSQVAKASRLLRGRHRLALSGTPVENHLGELWSLFEFLNPGLLGSMRAFSRTFAAKNTPPERREALARGLRPLLLRRTKEQVAPELPERIEQTLYCELEGKQKVQYEELRDHYRAALLGRIRKGGIDKARMHILEALLRLRQAACDPGLIDPNTDAPSAKVELLMDELRDVLAAGHRALVFSQFTSFLHIVRTALEAEGLSYLYLDGKTRDRQSLVEQFQQPDGPPLFLISLKAGGLGLNLTNADYIFLLDPWWNPAVEAQAIDRAHRIGRLKKVVAYRLIARDTVEEKILELQAKKRELAESIISEDNSVLRKLEVEDLEMLLG